MATSAEFVVQLKNDIQAFPKIRIKHPFLKAVCNGTATIDQIRTWAIQDYQFRAAVPDGNGRARAFMIWCRFPQ